MHDGALSRALPSRDIIRQRVADPSTGANTGVQAGHGVDHVLMRAMHRVAARVGPSEESAQLAEIVRMVGAEGATPLWSPSRWPSLRLSLHVIDLLEDELLTLWSSGEGGAAPVLRTVSRLRRLRARIGRRFQQLPGAPLAGLDGLEFLIEFVHDLRSPLGSLQLLADRLQQGCSGPLTPLQLRQLRLIYAATHALNNVTSNALQLTRDWDQLEEPEPRPFSVTRVLSDLLEIVRALAVQKGLELNFIRPSMDRRLGHPIELHRILLNLVTNGLKFTRTGSVTVRATDQDGDRVEFAVEDTGPGIDAAAEDALFQPFHRRDGHATFSAAGLGLAITQRLVRTLGGQLQYESAAGQGTRFYFSLALPVPGNDG